jgi:hypothetical protein
MSGKGLHVFTAGNVGFPEDGSVAEFRRQACPANLVDIPKREARTFQNKAAGNGRPDALRGADDNRDPIVQTSCHSKAFTSSGRWAEVAIGENDAATTTPERAAAFIAAAPWHIHGGSYWGHAGRKESEWIHWGL